jgi:inorganic pyrophosphatase
MNYAGLAVEAPFLKDITLAAITEFLKKRTDYLFNIGEVNESLDDDSKIIPTSLVASVDNDPLATICTTELEIAPDELEDQVLQ